MPATGPAPQHEGRTRRTPQEQLTPGEGLAPGEELAPGPVSGLGQVLASGEGLTTGQALGAGQGPGAGQGLGDRLGVLRGRLVELGSVVVAFSGGVDSSLLLSAAVRALGPGRVLAATGDSASLSRRERSAVRDITRQLGAEHVFVATHELESAGYRENSRARCWFCKDELIRRLLALAAARGLAHVATGTNADDLADRFRPGVQAAAGHGAVTPLADAGLTKAQVRAAGRAWSLPTWDKPASPCLSSRVAYGLTITRERLARVDAAEQALRESLRRAGIDSYDLRVRDLGGSALIQVDRGAVPEVTACRAALDAVRRAGFAAVEVDPRGFRSGSLNETHDDSHSNDPGEWPSHGS